MHEFYKSSAYARASNDDVDSSTIENQLELISQHVGQMSDIEIVAEYSDNGFSGVDFFRPSFTEMMKQIEAGKINCIVVKDLSRLGRNYIEVGELMDDILPRLNVRLIAINDGYDSLNPRTDSEEIVIPFKNLINEQYLRDASIKIRTNLKAKMTSGDYVGAKPPYGYARNPSNKNQLVIDEHAADVVREIFRMKIEGLSHPKIAERLNNLGEPSPADYCVLQGSKYRSHFKKSEWALWSPVAIGRILRNPVYIGRLVQGTGSTPNYKVKKRIATPESEWRVTENAHNAVISQNDFDIVQSLLSGDTRTSPQATTVYPLSGLIFCGDCGNSVVRKRVEKYSYYVCATHKAKLGCTSHNFSTSKLDAAVLEAIKTQINAVLDLERCLDFISNMSGNQKMVDGLCAKIAEHQSEIANCERFKRSVYEDYSDSEITKDDYIAFTKDYTDRIAELDGAIVALSQQVESLQSCGGSQHRWIEFFKQHKSISELSRNLVVNLISRIEIFEGKRIRITFRFADRLQALESMLKKNMEVAANGS